LKRLRNQPLPLLAKCADAYITLIHCHQNKESLRTNVKRSFVYPTPLFLPSVSLFVIAQSH